MQIPVPEHIAAITPYPPGKPMEELEREYGVSNAIKLASNENPWGPSPKAISAITQALAQLHRYPDGSCHALTQALAQYLGCRPEMLVFGNGSNEVIEFLIKAFVRPGDRVITSHPSFLMYQKFVQVHGAENRVIPLQAMQHDLEAIKAAVNDRTRLIFLDNPNNPCGTLIDKDAFEAFRLSLPPTVLLVLDEAYIDFVDPEARVDSFAALAPQCGAPLALLRTFSKAFGLAGLRLGFGVMAPELAAMLHRVRQPFAVNTLAQKAAIAALEDQVHYQAVVQGVRNGMDFLHAEVRRLGCRPFASHTNFFLIDVGGDASRLYEAMLYKGVIVRAMQAYGYPNFIRVTIGAEAENQRFIQALAKVLQDLAYV